MIYVDKTVEEWLAAYPLLGQIDMLCLCGRKAVGIRPYRTKEYAGLAAGSCECGRTGTTLSIPVSLKSIKSWNDVLSPEWI